MSANPIVPASDAAIAAAAAALRAGKLVAFPTETVYGLGADATNGAAVAGIYEAKGRPRFNPLISHVDGVAAAAAIAVLDSRAQALAAAFWPGPLTMVLPRSADCPVSELATAGLDSIAVRVPSHPVALALLTAVGRPVVAPSANRSGRVSATTAEHVATDLGDRVALILDSGPTEHGVESTVIDLTASRVRLLRPGAAAADSIERVLASPLVRSEGDRHRPNAPGQLESHYAPQALVRLDAAAPRPGEALLAFGPLVPRHDGPMLNLSAAGDLREAAANLFSALRKLDATGVSCIAVMPVADAGLGEAINDRLRRAAAPRP